MAIDMSQILAHNKVGKDTMYVIMTHTNPRRVVALRGFFALAHHQGFCLFKRSRRIRIAHLAGLVGHFLHIV